MSLTITQMPLPRSPQRSSARRLRIRGVVAHHMTIIGTGTGLANTACRGVWRTREASAHYGIDGTKVAQFLDDAVAAWATADFEGNHGRINVEHANQSGPPTWRISDDTLATGARLFAELHHKHNLGRPVMNVTMQRHKDFFPTACPGPWFGDAWAAYCRDAQQHYDLITNEGDDMPLSDADVKKIWAYKNSKVEKSDAYSILRRAARPWSYKNKKVNGGADTYRLLTDVKKSNEKIVDLLEQLVKK